MPFSGNKAKYLKSWAKENPYWTGAAGVYGAAPAYAIAKGTVPAVAKTVADFAVPDFIYNWETGKWFNPDDKDIKKIDKKAILQGNVSAKGPATEDTSTAESRAAFAKKRQDIRVKKYLDLMGYDRSKKTAVADALIDASKIVSDRGTLEKKNITRDLISPIIQATSKRFDKPEQIREAVGLMQVKADIAKEMEDPQVKALRALEIEKGEKALAGPDFKQVVTDRIIKNKNGGQYIQTLLVFVKFGKEIF